MFALITNTVFVLQATSRLKCEGKYHSQNYKSNLLRDELHKN